MQSKTISINGVDGSGKSTIILTLKQHLNEQGYNVKIKRSRPLNWPILSSLKYGRQKAEIIASTQDHKTKTVTGKYKSFLKFLYYYTDYLLGGIYIHIILLKPKTVIIFDRYYFDYICDQSRFSLSLNINFVVYASKFIHIPDLNIYLRAPENKIFKHRVEQTSQQIRNASNLYQELFTIGKEKYGSEFFIVEGLLPETNSIVKQIIDEH